MCARLLRHIPEDRQSRFAQASNRLFERIIDEMRLLQKERNSKEERR
jgi:hypothetical protein